MTERFDIVIAGGGIVGLATAYAITQSAPSLTVAVIEKETAVARHQTGRNSGVIHSGLYYQPGSLKATLCREGRQDLISFCTEHGIRFEICGKVVVAVDEAEEPRLSNLHSRGQANGVVCRAISQDELREREPHCNGVAALEVSDTGIVDYTQVAERLAKLVGDHGEIRLGHAIVGVHENADGVDVSIEGGSVRARLFINCTGLFCDRVMQSAGITPPAQIVPFRGEYYELSASARELCRHLIYPVPDPSFPFLGVHVTRMIDGSVECGPNAVLAFAREGYRKRDIRLRDLASTLGHAGFRKLAIKYYRTGAGEMWRSFSRHAFGNAVRRLLPDLQDTDLTPAEAGVRAQAIRPNGELVDDFLIHESERSLHVNNAPSPAATASLAIGRHIAAQALCKL